MSWQTHCNSFEMKREPHMVSVTFLVVPSVCGQIKVINISKVNDGGGLE